jgi:predicted nucleic-acid-binding protein
MSNFVYGKAKEAMLNGQINVTSNSLKVLLVSSSYIPSINLDQYVSDININHIINRSEAIQNVVNTLGVLDANDVVISEHNGSAFKAVVLYQNGTSDSNSRLISYIDTSAGLPFAGVNFSLPVTIIWNNSFSKIISL